MRIVLRLLSGILKVPGDCDLGSYGKLRRGLVSEVERIFYCKK